MPDTDQPIHASNWARWTLALLILLPPLGLYRLRQRPVRPGTWFAWGGWAAVWALAVGGGIWLTLPHAAAPVAGHSHHSTSKEQQPAAATDDKVYRCGDSKTWHELNSCPHLSQCSHTIAVLSHSEAKEKKLSPCRQCAAK